MSVFLLNVIYDSRINHEPKSQICRYFKGNMQTKKHRKFEKVGRGNLDTFYSMAIYSLLF